MRKHFLCLFLILQGLICIAQDREIDSLKTVIKNQKEDSLKVNSIILLSKKYIYTSPDSAVRYANQAKDLAQKLSFKKGIATSLKTLGIVSYNKSKYVEAINFWKEASAIFDSIRDKEGVANIQSNIGATYFNQGDDTKANEYYFSSLQIAEEISDTLRIATALNNIAAVYQHKDQKKALNFYRRALPFGEAVTDEDKRNGLVGTTTAGMGESYMNDTTDMSNYEQKLDTALFYTNRSLQAYKGTVDEPFALKQLGEVYLRKREFDKAIAVQKRAYDIAKNFESADDMAISLLALAKTYQMQGESKLALETFKRAEEVAKQTESIYSLRDIYKGQSELYGASHDFINAFKYQYLLTGVKDSIYNIEGDKKLQAIQFTFDLQKKEGEIGMQQQEIRRQKMVRNSFVGGFAVVLLFAGIFLNQRNKISKEKKRSDELLLNILPSETAEELKATGTAKAKSFQAVTVMFTDFKNFTQASELLTPEELVKEINHCYSEFDKIITRYGIEKIKTIGDSYMCAGGLPVTNSTHPVDVVKAGLEMQQFISENKKERIANGQPFFDLRLGIHTGPVVAGIVGIKKFAYDIWGDTVNTASRMESSGEIGKVNVSGSTHELIKGNFVCIHRGKVEAKNKGQIDMYFVESVL